MRRLLPFAALALGLALATPENGAVASPHGPSLASPAAGPRLITTGGDDETPWELDVQAFTYWCERSVNEVGHVAWFAELADVSPSQRAGLTAALDACVKRRRDRHGRVGLALPRELAVKVAQGSAFTASERWLLGYVDHIIIDDDLVARVGKPVSLAPLLDKPELRGVVEYRIHATTRPAAAAGACGWLASLGNATTTRLSRLYVSPACDELLSTSRLPTLAAVKGLTSSSALALRWQARLPALIEFQVADERDDEATEVGIGAPAALLTKMTRLRVSDREWHVLRARPLPLLRELHVDVVSLSLAQVAALTHSVSFPGMQRLTITVPSLAPDVHIALWKQLDVSAMRSFALHASTSMTARAATAMIESAQLPRLRELELVGAVLSDEAVALLAAARAAFGLQALTLRMAGVDGKKLAVLARARWLRPAVLDLGQNPLHGEALAAFSRAPIAANLSELRLAGCGLDDAAARTLAATYGFFSLRYLDLAHNAFTDAGLATLLRSGSFASLWWLDVFGGRTTPNALLCATQIARPLPSAPCPGLRLITR
ncbi:MAG: hypothetical protein IPL79_09330 [Myxococcales bacterium]|nr:hypothetical protein [Myxococcales bacterium]